MAQIKSRNTKPEIFVHSELKSKGIEFETHYPIPGKPDIVFPKKKIAVFINGEFWHGRHFKEEKVNYKEFWKKKIMENMKRDRKNYRLLKNDGWTVIKIWDKDLKKRPDKEIGKILKRLNSINQ